MFTEAVYIPRLLDARERILFFSTFEVVSVFGGLMVGQLSDQWLLAMVVGISSFIGVRKLDQKGYFDTVGYYAYWYFPDSLLKLLQMNYFEKAPSHVRELTG